MTLVSIFPASLRSALLGLPVAVFCCASGGEAFASGKLENIAFDKPYRFLPANAAGALGKASPKLLVDGKLSGDPIWDQGDALKIRASRPVQITFDLKEVFPIAGVAVSSAAGGATSGKDIFVWPGRIDIYTSEDNRDYYYAGELTSLHDTENTPLPPFGEYARRKISTTGLATKGRYLKLVFSYSREVFIDEIEVFKGEAALLAKPYSGAPLNGESAIGEAFQLSSIDPNKEKPAEEAAMAAKAKELRAFVIKRRYRQDIASLLEQARKLPAGAALVAKLETLKGQVEQDSPVLGERDTLPHGELGEEILVVQAAIWRELGVSPLTIWQGERWDYTAWLQMPPVQTSQSKGEKGAPNVSLHASLMQGEYRAVSFNITNAGASAKTLHINIRDLPGGDNPSYITLHPVAWTETAWRLAVASALPVATKTEHGYEVRIPAGVTQPIWLTIQGSAKAGDFAGKIEILDASPESSAGAAVGLPLSLKVAPIAFPEKQSLDLGGFELASNESLRRRYGVFRETLPAFAKMLRENLANGPWTTRTEFAFGKFNSQHEYASPSDQPEKDAFHNWTTKLWPGSNRFFVALTVGTKDHKAVIQGCDYASDPEGFQKRITQWLTFWKGEVERANLKPEQVYLKIIDEPGYNSAAPFIEDEGIRIWAEAIHKSGTGFRVFINPIHDAPWEVNPALHKAADLLCVKYSHLLREGGRYFDFYKKQGRELAIYECYGAPGHLYDPYSYFRLQAWMTWKLGGTAMFFWNFSETSTADGFMDSWNTGLNQWYYTPLFLSPTSVTSSIQMEAIREGIEDFEYLKLLEAAIAKARQAGSASPALAKAEQLLLTAPDKVLGGDVLQEPRWAWPKKIDRKGADIVRAEILDCLVALQGE